MRANGEVSTQLQLTRHNLAHYAASTVSPSRPHSATYYEHAHCLYPSQASEVGKMLACSAPAYLTIKHTSHTHAGHIPHIQSRDENKLTM